MSIFSKFFNRIRLLNRNKDCFQEIEVPHGTLTDPYLEQVCPKCGEKNCIYVSGGDILDEYCEITEAMDYYCSKCHSVIYTTNDFCLEKTDAIPVYDKPDDSILEMW